MKEINLNSAARPQDLTLPTKPKPELVHFRPCHFLFQRIFTIHNLSHYHIELFDRMQWFVVIITINCIHIYTFIKYSSLFSEKWKFIIISVVIHVHKSVIRFVFHIITTTNTTTTTTTIIIIICTMSLNLNILFKHLLSI